MCFEQNVVRTGSDEGQEADEYLSEFALLCEGNPTGGMRLLSCSLNSFFNRKGDTAAGGLKPPLLCCYFFVIGY